MGCRFGLGPCLHPLGAGPVHPQFVDLQLGSERRSITSDTYDARWRAGIWNGLALTYQLLWQRSSKMPVEQDCERAFGKTVVGNSA